MSVNSKIHEPESPGSWINSNHCICGSKYINFNSKINFKEGINIVRNHNGGFNNGGGFRSRGPIL